MVAEQVLVYHLVTDSFIQRLWTTSDEIWMVTEQVLVYHLVTDSFIQHLWTTSDEIWMVTWQVWVYHLVTDSFIQRLWTTSDEHLRSGRFRKKYPWNIPNMNEQKMINKIKCHSKWPIGKKNGSIVFKNYTWKCFEFIRLYWRWSWY
jgi:hypothetical protein